MSHSVNVYHKVHAIIIQRVRPPAQPCNHVPMQVALGAYFVPSTVFRTVWGIWYPVDGIQLLMGIIERCFERPLEERSTGSRDLLEMSSTGPEVHKWMGDHYINLVIQLTSYILSSIYPLPVAAFPSGLLHFVTSRSVYCFVGLDC